MFLSLCSVAAGKILQGRDAHENEFNVDLHLDPESVSHFKGLGMTWAKVGRLHGLNRMGMYRFRKKFGIEDPRTELTDEELRTVIADLAADNPEAGISLFHVI